MLQVDILVCGGDCSKCGIIDANFEERLDIDSNPEEEEEGAEAHEEAGHPRDHQLLGQLPSELGRRHLET